jgi:hypothetical protein
MFIVKTAAARMPTSCWGRYGHVAVIELYPGFETCAMISERARGVKRIVARWDRQHHGTTGRSAFQTALREAQALASQLNYGGASECDL